MDGSFDFDRNASSMLKTKRAELPVDALVPDQSYIIVMHMILIHSSYYYILDAMSNIISLLHFSKALAAIMNCITPPST